MLGTLFGSRAGADATLRVGETTTLSFAGMPIPSTAGPLMNLTGETRMKLPAISRVAGERLARLDQSVTASLATPAAAAGVPMTMTATSGGIVEWNLDRGYVRSGETTIEMEAEVMQAKMHGRISTSVRGSN
jgi:hypothetical protein